MTATERRYSAAASIAELTYHNVELALPAAPRTWSTSFRGTHEVTHLNETGRGRIRTRRRLGTASPKPTSGVYIDW